MGGGHQRTLEQVFTAPPPATLAWRDIEALLSYYGTVTEGRGSRIRVAVNGVTMNLHRPHPGKEAHRYQVKHIRQFLERAGVTP
jgi:hypothetical protein